MTSRSHRTLRSPDSAGKTPYTDGRAWLRTVTVIGWFLSCSAPAANRIPNEHSEQVRGFAPAAVGQTPSVVLLDSMDSLQDGSTLDTIAMDQIDVSFTPSVLVAHVGQVVEFRNSEQIPHNVRARVVGGTTDVLNVSTGPDEAYHHAFVTAGEYTITCDIHPGMRATVLVVRTPYVTTAAGDGTFAFDTVPPGTYTLRIWSADETRRMERQVTIDGTTGQVILEAGRQDSPRR